MKSKIVHAVLYCFIMGLWLGGCNHRNDLEGTWVGCDIRRPLVDWTLTITDNQFYLVREDFSMWYIGKFNLNNNCLLKKIDLNFKDTHIQIQNGQILLGIYEIDGNHLTLSTSRHCNSPRPRSFDEYDKAVVFNFVRG